MGIISGLFKSRDKPTDRMHDLQLVCRYLVNIEMFLQEICKMIKNCVDEWIERVII